jgi:hypothetical protein
MAALTVIPDRFHEYYIISERAPQHLNICNSAKQCALYYLSLHPEFFEPLPFSQTMYSGRILQISSKSEHVKLYRVGPRSSVWIASIDTNFIWAKSKKHRSFSTNSC